MAQGLGANVIIIDRNLNRLREIDDIYNGAITTLATNAWTIAESLKHADLVIGAVLIPGAAAPRLVKRETIARMKRGAVMVDVAIDQGGCFETSHATTHTDPVYFVDEVLHYCVSNMPAAVPHTSTYGLTNATFPYLMQLVSRGVADAIQAHAALAAGVNCYKGQCTYKAVADEQGIAYTPLPALL
jgi:alanine dehydrogenase